MEPWASQLALDGLLGSNRGGLDSQSPVPALNMEPWASQLALDGLSGLIGGGVVDWQLPVAALNMEPWASQLALDGLSGLIGGGRASPSFSIPPFIIESAGNNCFRPKFESLPKLSTFGSCWH